MRYTGLNKAWTFLSKILLEESFLDLYKTESVKCFKRLGKSYGISEDRDCFWLKGSGNMYQLRQEVKDGKNPAGWNRRRGQPRWKDR